MMAVMQTFGPKAGLAAGATLGAVVVVASLLTQRALYGHVMTTFPLGLPLTLLYLLFDTGGPEWQWWSLTLAVPIVNWAALGAAVGIVTRHYARKRAA